MPVQSLPDNPSIENLRKQAKSLLNAVQAGRPDALARVHEFHPHSGDALKRFSLSDAQCALARNYGFASWSKLKQHVDLLRTHLFAPPADDAQNDSEPIGDRFIRLACLNYQTDYVDRRDRARKLLAEHPAISRENIYTAAAVGDVSTVRQMLLENTGLANRRGGPYGWDPLLYAAYSRLNSAAPERSTLEVARLLLQHGADPNAGFLWDGRYLFTVLTGAFGEGERGPLHQPEHQDCYALARLLLEAGADPNDSQTLYNRMFTGGVAHLELLFEFGLGKSGAGVWFRRLGNLLETPSQMLQQQICWAAKYNHTERVRLLIEHGVDVNSPDTRLCRTPYELAVLNGNREIAEDLSAHGARSIVLSDLDAFGAACLAGDAGEARRLLAKDPALIDQLGDRRAELLHLAAEADRREAIRLMAELHFDLNEVKRTTPLHHAAAGGHLEMVKLLIELGGDPLIRDATYNGTALGWANFNGRDTVAEFLRNFESRDLDLGK